MPGLVPTSPDDPAAPANRAAWATLTASSTPMLVAFSDGDPITGGMAPILQREMAGARGIARGPRVPRQLSGSQEPYLAADFIQCRCSGRWTVCSASRVG